MAVNRLRATICGTSYTLISEESLSYMRDLVASVDNDMEQILQNDRRMDTLTAAVLTAVQFADKAIKEEKAADTLRVECKQLVDASEKLQSELAEAKAETARLKEEALQLRKALMQKETATSATSTGAAASAASAAPAAAPAMQKPLTSFEEILDEEEL